ncbi:acetoacetyl-CoA synthetase [Mytilus galloprovincialis]|uniref:Acetoacetyl-CoA synthetase n=1 Tax=Mytilus galloprovincialis TaxID=29158 RepID=A0A8B6FPN8_MYTGA|nr:acetoacetyl-CoA synthetase [Mytilus galloprovincialis]
MNMTSLHSSLAVLSLLYAVVCLTFTDAIVYIMRFRPGEEYVIKYTLYKKKRCGQVSYKRPRNNDVKQFNETIECRWLPENSARYQSTNHNLLGVKGRILNYNIHLYKFGHRTAQVKVSGQALEIQKSGRRSFYLKYQWTRNKIAFNPSDQKQKMKEYSNNDNGFRSMAKSYEKLKNFLAIRDGGTMTVFNDLDWLYSPFTVFSQINGNLYITAFQQSDFQNESFSTNDTIPPHYLWASHWEIFGMLGESIKLKCIFGGNPTPEIHWESNTGTIPDSRHTMYQGGQDLRITHLREEDCAKPYWTEGGEPKDIETSIGVSATFYCNASGDPQPELEWYINGVRLKGKTHKLESLKAILSTGSPLKPQSYDYVYTDIKKDLLLASISGGTDIIACFMGQNWTVPVYKGEIQGPNLGCAIETRDEEGKQVFDEAGELVCTKPFPSMPVFFWNDPDGKKYKKAYFEMFPGVWAHGDHCCINSQTGGIVMLGRSDGVLNPNGVRFGSAEIYNVVESFKEIQDSVCVAQRKKDNSEERVVLFVKMATGSNFSSELVTRIKTCIRNELSVRYVPTVVLPIDDIPYTINSKKVEAAVRKAMMGEEVVQKGALANPQCLELYHNIKELQNY